MKVYIGPYKNYIGPYQIASALFFWYPKKKDELKFNHDADFIHKFGGWLSENKDGSRTKLDTFCEWLHSKKKRKVKVNLHPYDTWNMDNTLSLIILPMLKQLHSTNHGFGLVDDADAPEELRLDKGVKDEYGGPDSLAQSRWNWVMEELIWTFTQLEDGDSDSQFYDHTESDKYKDIMESVAAIKVDYVGLEAHQKRIANGLRLFGVYYQNLWD